MALDLLRRGLKLSHLQLLAELLRQSKLTDAASVLGISQPAASRLIAEVERIVEAEVYVRSGRGVELTEIGRHLASRCTRILREFSDAGRDIEHYKLGQSGQVRIGSVTGPAIENVLPIVSQLRTIFPEISITLEVGPSSTLVSMLGEGRLDFALCRIPAGVDAYAFEERPLTQEPACLVARIGHPLSQIPAPISAKLLLHYDWVLPPVGAPLRTSVERAFRSRGLELPSQMLTVSSFLFSLVAIQRTNTLVPVARSVAKSFAHTPDGRAGTLSILECDLQLSLETFSFLTRKGQILTPAAELVAQRIIETIGGNDPEPGIAASENQQ